MLTTNKPFRVTRLNRCIFPIPEGDYTREELDIEIAKRVQKLETVSREGTFKLVARHKED